MQGFAPGPPGLSGRSRAETGTGTSELAGWMISIQALASLWGQCKSAHQLQV